MPPISPDADAHLLARSFEHAKSATLAWTPMFTRSPSIAELRVDARILRCQCRIQELLRQDSADGGRAAHQWPAMISKAYPEISPFRLVSAQMYCEVHLGCCGACLREPFCADSRPPTNHTCGPHRPPPKPQPPQPGRPRAQERSTGRACAPSESAALMAVAAMAVRPTMPDDHQSSLHRRYRIVVRAMAMAAACYIVGTGSSSQDRRPR